MFERWRQRRAQVRGVEFCEACGQVCTAGCRAQARVERMRIQAMTRVGMLR